MERSRSTDLTAGPAAPRPGGIAVTVDDRSVQVEPSRSILGAIRQSGGQLRPPDCGPADAWTRHPVCPAIHLAEVDGELVSSALLARRSVRQGMRIRTSSPALDQALAERARLLRECHECVYVREMQRVIAAEAESAGFIPPEHWERPAAPPRGAAPSILHDPSVCVRCRSCVDACRVTQSVEALRFDETEGILIDDRRCVRCGQCIHTCPAGATHKYSVLMDLLGCTACPFDKPQGGMRETDETAAAWSILHAENLYPVAQFAPAVRASIAQEFGLPAGTLLTGKLYAALRRLGFKRVWDTNFSADLTIMEEGSELIHRLTHAGTLPMWTSCCPAWVRFVETFFPQLLPHLSTAKSPQQMLGAMAKAYAAPRLGVDPRRMRLLSFMPCTAKRAEAARPEMDSAFRFLSPGGSAAPGDSFPDVDMALTTRELARLLKMAGIDLCALPEEEPDPLLGSYTGAAPIFGRTGGVMEAALRTAAVLVAGAPLPSLEFHDLEGMAGIKTAGLQVGSVALKVAVVHGLANARTVCESVASGGEFSLYHFIEFMACPGGCIGGGGQPIPTSLRTKTARAAGLNADDREVCPLRMSHENPEVKAAYADFLHESLGRTSHALLHTSYAPRALAS